MGFKEKFNSFAKRFKRTPKEYFKLLWTPFLVAALVITADLITKAIIENTLEVNQSIVIIPNFIEFYYTLNDGAAFSFLSGRMVFLIIFTTVAVLGLLTYLFYDADRLRPFVKVAFGFIIGGALGNLYDRIAFGQVRDFIHWIYFGLDLPLLGTSFGGIFNVADLFLTVGAGILLVSLFIGIYNPSAQKAADNMSEGAITPTEENTEADAQNNIAEADEAQINAQSDEAQSDTE